MAQKDGVAWSIFDTRIAGIARQFEDFRDADAIGAIIVADTVSILANKLGIPTPRLSKTILSVSDAKPNRFVVTFDRTWSDLAPLTPPYLAVKVIGALFQIHGGLVVDHAARLLDNMGETIAHLFAVGGVACSISGTKASGYLSGNGLLTAFACGFIAGTAAANAALE